MDRRAQLRRGFAVEGAPEVIRWEFFLRDTRAVALSKGGDDRARTQGDRLRGAGESSGKWGQRG